MHARSCRCGECRLMAKEEAAAGQTIYRFFGLGRFRSSFREANRLWVSAIKDEKWETIDPIQSQHIAARWNATSDGAKTRIKEMCDVVLS